MQIIAHRRNSITELRDTHPSLGIEVDLRLFNSELICQHDPFVPGELFSDWLKEFHHKTLILNLKEEGLENTVLEALSKANVKDFFFLDQSFPFLLKFSKTGMRKTAVRISEYECIDTALKLAGAVDWVWVDIFNAFPLGVVEIEKLRKANYKICIVSPELHGQIEEAYVKALQEAMCELNFKPDAVCTKRPDRWEGFSRA